MRAAGIVLGIVADRLIPDPASRFHPVAIFGNATATVEEYTYRDCRFAGLVHCAICMVPLAVGGALLEGLSRRHRVIHVLATAGCTWMVLGAASLSAEGRRMADLLDRGDLEGARAQLGHLCGRDPDHLDEPELARATIESMAENTADAAVASLWWGAILGIPGMLVHRAANTLDAMIGHKNTRYNNFGYCAAIFDDLLDWIPARITGSTIAALASLVGGDVRHTLAVLARDHANHPSPNGGWCESAMAGALGVQLGGTNIYYSGRVEHRGLLGDGPRPRARHIVAATRLVTATTTATGLACAIALGVAERLGRRSSKRR